MGIDDGVPASSGPTALRPGVNRRWTGLTGAGRHVAGVLGLGVLGAGLVLAGCTSAPEAMVMAPEGTAVVLPATTAALLAIEASRAVWRSSPVAVTVADPAEAAAAAAAARDLGAPAFLLEDASQADLAAELDRLGVTHVLHVGSGGAPQIPGVRVVTAPADLAGRSRPTPLEGVVAVTDASAASAVATGTLAAAGADVLELGAADPRATPAGVTALAAVKPRSVIGVGGAFGPAPRFAQRVGVAVTGVQLPGGGQTIFDGKRYVALYGHPRSKALGALGEQGATQSVERVKKLASAYAPLAEERIIPAFEIIATVATGSAGKDGNYSNEWSVEALRPLVDAAERAGIYVVLDLQPGRADFLTQAKRYEELLIRPHVGLAMDPEWRLAPDELPLQQVGSVSSAELNAAMAWLAELTARKSLPQKMVVLHQFRRSMITERSDLDLAHDELSVVVQMDGNGTLGQKLDTWRALQVDAPSGLRFGWKNFYDEDRPTPSPTTTFAITPRPWWVSYQ